MLMVGRAVHFSIFSLARAGGERSRRRQRREHGLTFCARLYGLGRSRRAALKVEIRLPRAPLDTLPPRLGAGRRRAGQARVAQHLRPVHGVKIIGAAAVPEVLEPRTDIAAAELGVGAVRRARQLARRREVERAAMLDGDGRLRAPPGDVLSERVDVAASVAVDRGEG